MKTKPARPSRRRRELLREFFACAVIIATIKSDRPVPANTAKPPPTGPSPSGRI